MEGRWIGFAIWVLIGCVFIGFGIHAFVSGKPTGFWANAKLFQVADVRKYNSAMGKLWLAAGSTFILLGLPLLDGQNSPWIMVTIIGSFFWVIGLMAVYEMVISKKYRKS